LVEKLPTLRSTGVVRWCRKPGRRLRKAARDWAALRVRQALTQDGISFVVEPVLDGPMPPRLAAFAWAGLSQVGFLADFTAALVGLVAVDLDHLLQTRKGQRGLRWDLRGGTNPPNPRCAARYLVVAAHIVRCAAPSFGSARLSLRWRKWCPLFAGRPGRYGPRPGNPGPGRSSPHRLR